MKNCLALIHFLMLGLGLAACSSKPVQSYKDTSNGAPKPGQTFAWLTQDDAINLRLQNPQIDYLTDTVTIHQRPDLEAKLRPAIEDGLIQQGFVRSTGGQPDFYVTFYSKEKDQDWASTWKGSTPGVQNVPVVLSPGFDRKLLRNFREGNVYLVLYSSRSRSSAWTGVASGIQNLSNPSQPEIQAGVGRLMTELHGSG